MTDFLFSIKRRTKMFNIFEGYIKGETILDVGCNSGIASKYFGEGGFSVTGIDIEKKWIDYSKQYYPQGEFMLGDIMKWGKRYDTILLIGVLEEIPANPVDVLKRIKRNLNKDGRVIISVRNMHSIKRRVKTFFGLEPVDIFDGRLWYFTKNRLKKVISKAGYDIIEVTSNKEESFRRLSFPMPDFLSEEIVAIVEPKVKSR